MTKKKKVAELEQAVNDARLPEVRVSPARDNMTREVINYQVFLMATMESGSYSVVDKAIPGEYQSEEAALAEFQRLPPKEFVHKKLWKGQEKYINENGLYRR